MGEATAERHAPKSKHEWSKTIDNMRRVEQPDGIMVTLFRGAGGMAKGRLPRVRRRLPRREMNNVATDDMYHGRKWKGPLEGQLVRRTGTRENRADGEGDGRSRRGRGREGEGVRVGERERAREREGGREGKLGDTGAPPFSEHWRSTFLRTVAARGGHGAQ